MIVLAFAVSLTLMDLTNFTFLDSQEGSTQNIHMAQKWSAVWPRGTCDDLLVNYSYFFQTCVLLNSPSSPMHKLALHKSIWMPESTLFSRGEPSEADRVYLWWLYWNCICFLLAAVTNHHQFSGSKKTIHLLSYSSGGQKSKNRTYWAKIKELAGLCSFWRF